MSDTDAGTDRQSAPVTRALEPVGRVRWLEEPEEFAEERTVLVAASQLYEAMEACLLVVQGNELARRFRLQQDDRVIGRSIQADIQIPAEGVSRVHARIEHKNIGVYQLIDLESTNGTFVNGARIQEHTLQNGDRILLGDTTLRFLQSPRIEATCYDEIYRLTTTDDATGIYNKRYFFQTLEREVARAIRHQRPLTLLMLEVDGFDEIRQKFGFVAGDSLLVQLAERLRATSRVEDLFARFGNAEFCLLLSETETDGARAAAQRIQQLVADHPFSYDGHEIQLTVTIGIATLDDHRPTIENIRSWANAANQRVDLLINDAILKLVRAQSEGPNQIAF